MRINDSLFVIKLGTDKLLATPDLVAWNLTHSIFERHINHLGTSKIYCTGLERSSIQCDAPSNGGHGIEKRQRNHLWGLTKASHR